MESGTMNTVHKKHIYSNVHLLFSFSHLPYICIYIYIRHNTALPKSDYISPTTAAPTSFKSKLNKSFTRRTTGHCLGTFQTAKLCFDYTPLQNGSVSHYPPQLSSFSLSLSNDRLCGLVVRVHGYRSRGLGSIPGATRFYEK
jgi:hypothetical protein